MSGGFLFGAPAKPIRAFVGGTEVIRLALLIFFVQQIP